MDQDNNQSKPRKLTPQEAFRRINEIAIAKANELDVDEPLLVNPNKPHLVRDGSRNNS